MSSTEQLAPRDTSVSVVVATISWLMVVCASLRSGLGTLSEVVDIPAAWVSDPTRQHEARYWDGQRWTEHVSDGGVAGTDPLPPPPRPVPPPPRLGVPQREDPAPSHFLRFFGIWLAMVLLCYVIVGIVWAAFALAATGRRKRDLLMLLIPVWGTIVMVQTIWRYTA